VFVRTGRWGRRRVRVEQCWAVVRTEDLYGRMLHSDLKAGSSAGVEVHVALQNSNLVSAWHLTVELVPNRIWRIGRLFLLCPRCSRRATRLYVPLSGDEPKCRCCWGLNYESQSWSYHGDWWQRLSCYSTSDNKREAARRAARKRYVTRRRALS
jgi:hypothetical protein